MEHILLERTNEPDLQFTGHEIAAATTHTREGPNNTRYTNYTLYKTSEDIKSCKYILYTQNITLWVNEQSNHKTNTFNNLEEIRDHLCPNPDYISDTVKELLQAAGLPIVETLK